MVAFQDDGSWSERSHVLGMYNRGWDGWLASLTQQRESRSWWWTGRPGVLRFMGSQRVGHDWATELKWTEWSFYLFILGHAGSSLLHGLFSSCGEWGHAQVMVHGLLVAMAPLVSEHQLRSTGRIVVTHGPELLRSRWDPPRPGLEPVSPALAGWFLTTEPPGKPHPSMLY